MQETKPLSIWSLIASDYRGYGRPILAQGFWATLNHRIYASLHRKAPGPLKKLVRLCHLVSVKLCEIVFGIYIGVNVKLGRGFVIEHFGCVIIHSETRIGDNVRLRQGVTIGNKSDKAPNDVPVLGNGVDVGAGAKILGPITLGDGCVVGANAVVIRDVPAGAMAVGVPAVVRMPKLRAID